MWRNQNLRTLQRVDPHILAEVTVVTNQNSRARAIGQIKQRVVRAAANVFVDKRVQLAMTRRAAIGHRHHVAVKQSAIRIAFNEACADGQLILRRQGQ